MQKIVPCKDCTDRNEKCHSVCKKYLEWKAELDEEHKKILEGRIKYAESRRIQKESIARMRKKSRLK